MAACVQPSESNNNQIAVSIQFTIKTLDNNGNNVGGIYIKQSTKLFFRR